eukprot:1116850-Amphidinium_carterae.1
MAMTLALEWYCHTIRSRRNYCNKNSNTHTLFAVTAAVLNAIDSIVPNKIQLIGCHHCPWKLSQDSQHYLSLTQKIHFCSIPLCAFLQKGEASRSKRNKGPRIAVRTRC